MTDSLFLPVKKSVTSFSFLLLLLGHGGGEVICPVAFIRNLGALRLLSHDARVSASVSQFRENTPPILLFRVLQMRETEQKRNFPPPSQVSTGIMKPEVC